MLQDRRVQYALGAIAMAVLGAVVALILSPGESESALGDRVVVTTGAGSTVSSDLPLTASDARTAGWRDLVTCYKGKGRYFEHTDAQGNPDPFVLMFNADNELIGVYLTSKVEMPGPWEHVPTGLEGVASYQFEHWSLPVYFKDPTLACGETAAG
jgi:hypothetical protein